MSKRLNKFLCELVDRSKDESLVTPNGSVEYPEKWNKLSQAKAIDDGLVVVFNEGDTRSLKLTASGLSVVSGIGMLKWITTDRGVVITHDRGGEADPIKELRDVGAIYGQLRRFGYYREAELFMIGCNCALRISDLLRLKPSDIVRKELGGKTTGYIEQITEKKTGKKKRLTINHVGMHHVDILMNLYPDNTFLFESEWVRKRGRPPAPITDQAVWLAFVKVRERLELDYRFSTHTMRKTFGYHAYQSGIDINVLRKLFNHSSSSQTLTYIGIDNERVEEAYLNNVIGVGVGE